jgi:hypothetical protein
MVAALKEHLLVPDRFGRCRTNSLDRINLQSPEIREDVSDITAAYSCCQDFLRTTSYARLAARLQVGVDIHMARSFAA